MKIDHLLSPDEFYRMPTNSLGNPLPFALEERLYDHLPDLTVRDFLLLQLVHQIQDLTHEIEALQECIAPGRD